MAVQFCRPGGTRAVLVGLRGGGRFPKVTGKDDNNKNGGCLTNKNLCVLRILFKSSSKVLPVEMFNL